MSGFAIRFTEPRAVVAAGTILLAVLAAGVLFCFDPSHYPFYPLCFFHKATGLLCPGCGSLRALHQLLHGNLAVAFRFNALLVLSLPLAAWLSVRMALAVLTNKPARLSLRSGWLWCGLAVMVAFGILR